MMSNKYKRVLVFVILYTVLFVFDGVKLLASLMPSAIANYLVYVVLALYGSFLFKDRLIQQWNEIRKTKRKFFFGVFKGLSSSLSNDHPFCSPFGNIETSFGFEWSRAK